MTREKTEGQPLNPTKLQRMRRFREETLQSQQRLTDEELVYGFLVRDDSMYRYLRRYMVDNNFQMNICRRNFINSMMSGGVVEQIEDEGIFSTKGGMFYSTLLGCLLLFAVCILVGLVYEFHKRKRTNEVSPNSNSNSRSKNNSNDNDSNRDNNN